MTSDYEDFRFERPGTLDLVFRGRVIATADSRDNTRKIPKDRPRWTEIVIYLTDSDKWIVLNAGCSDVPGETDKEAFYICSTPEEVGGARRKRATAGAQSFFSSKNARDSARRSPS